MHEFGGDMVAQMFIVNMYITIHKKYNLYACENNTNVALDLMNFFKLSNA